MKPKIAILSCATGGGAGIAAKRLADVLKERDDLTCDFIDLTMLGGLPEEAIYNGSATNRIISDTHYTAEYPGFVRQWLVNLLCAYDVLNFHWATMLVTVSEILELANRGKKVVLTMHDFFYATGGCHYQSGCNGQGRGCTNCPQVNETVISGYGVTLAFEEKMKLLNHGNVRLTAPSKYLADKVDKLISNPRNRVHVIRNPFISPDRDGTGISRQTESARKVMIIADSFGERRKNIRLSIDAASVAKENYIPSLELHLVGSVTPEVQEYCENLKLNIISHGHVSDPIQLTELYKHCGILLACSSDDNWPNILVEASVHGTIPVVGPGHGCEEFVNQYQIGFIAEKYTADQFALQISRASDYLITDANRNHRVSVIDKIILDHSPESVIKKYIAVMND
jgi:glycosyltransferase involved in cell wall biosynthesis